MNLMSCHSSSSYIVKRTRGNSDLTVALAGNANVGKSLIFNRLTGSSQIIGNWPGKTVEKAEGTLEFEGKKITVVDLPGIYSFATFGMEEIVSREYIALKKPDVVINVVDAAVLERNLFFTLQLLEMEAPLLICLNQLDAAEKKGISINIRQLEKALGVPVIPTIGIRGEGINELTIKTVEFAESGSGKTTTLKYGVAVEERICILDRAIQAENLELEYPSRWIAIKLLEKDLEITDLVAGKSENVIKAAEALATEVSNLYGEPSFVIIAAERYSFASEIANKVQRQSEVNTTTSDKLELITTHRVFGYVASVGVIAGLLLWTFIIGDFLSGYFHMRCHSFLQ
ncbi:MAG: ferrous iron transport protein [Thermoproteota archaeon]|nr:ferrous iron transport protein [Thermoproteota archaeon]